MHLQSIHLSVTSHIQLQLVKVLQDPHTAYIYSAHAAGYFGSL